MCIFVVSLRSSEFHAFPNTSPILLSTSLSDPSCVRCSPSDMLSSLFAPVPVLPPPDETPYLPLPKNSILSSVCLSSYPFFGSPGLLLSTPSAILLPALPVVQYHPQISYLLSFCLR